MNDKYKIELAYFRFSVIAPVFQGTFLDVSKAAYFRRIAEQPLTLPDGKTICYNPKTFCKWENLYASGGMDALMPTGRSDHGKPRCLDDSVIEEIYSLKKEFPRITATLVYHRLIEKGFIKASQASVSSIQRFIKNNDLGSARLIQMKDRKAFEEAYATAMFQADTCHGPYITENGIKRKTYLIMIIDDCSRLIVGGRYFYNDNAYNFQCIIKDAVSRYGIPHKLYMDNGSPYRNEQLSLILGSIGTVELHCAVRDGASKGKVERNFRTLKDRWLNGLNVNDFSSLAAFNSALSDYIHRHNTSLHGAIGMSPIERYTKDISQIRNPKSREWLDESFMNRVTRKVNRDSTISIDKQLFDVPLQFMDTRVEVRYLPNALDQAYIFYKEKQYPIRVTNKVENSRTKRTNDFGIDYSHQGGESRV